MLRITTGVLLSFIASMNDYSKLMVKCLGLHQCNPTKEKRKKKKRKKEKKMNRKCSVK